MMTDEKEPNEPRRQAWIESLLESATHHEDHSERISRAMAQVDDAVMETPTTVPTLSRRSAFQWSIIAVAASLLLIAFFSLDNSQSRAMAAVKRSLTVAAEPETRKYAVTMTHVGRAERSQAIEGDLFVNGNNRFALRLPGPVFGASIWVGNDGSESWVVPPIGPIRKGSGLVISHWLRSRGELDTPYLHINTLLTRMSRGYRLQMLRNESVTLPSGSIVECQRVHAELESTDRPNWPTSIELWCNRDGMAVLVEARWNGDDQLGLQSLVVTFEGDEPERDLSWFSAEGHYTGERPLLQIDAAEAASP